MSQLNEGLEAGNLKRLVHTELHIDEFKSKLGQDKDVIVFSFKVVGKDPAVDLVNFIEKGYSWVIDADVSSGEMSDGDYIVFIEAERNKEIPENFISLMNDVMNLTEQELSNWRFRYRTSTKDYDLTEENLREVVPCTPKDYTSEYGHEDLDKLKAAAGVKVTTKAPKNDFTESLRIAAGIR